MPALEIVALDTVTPQLRAPGTGDTYSAPRALALTPETLTGSAATSGLSITQTWNTTGTPTAFSVAVTDTASNAASRLLDVTLGGTSYLTLTKGGNLHVGYASGKGLVIDSPSGTTPYAVIGRYFNTTHSGIITVNNTGIIGFGATNASLSAADTYLSRDAANTLALRNGVNAQAFRVYTTYTDASNHSRLALTGAAITLETAGTGADDIDLTLTPAGTGTLKFGTHSALAAETVTGYITIKDAGGTTRKLAVVS